MSRTRILSFAATLLSLCPGTPATAREKAPPPKPERTPYYIPHLLNSVEDAAGKLRFLQPRISSGGVTAQQMTVDQNGVNIYFSAHGVTQHSEYYWSWGGGYNAPVVTPYENNWTFSASYATAIAFFAFPRDMGITGNNRYSSVTLSGLDDVHMFLDAFVTLTVAGGNADFFVYDFDWNAADPKVTKKLKLEDVSVVTDIQAGGPADKAGLQEGDLIVGIDGNPVKGMVGTMFRGLKRSPAGYTAHLSVVRNGTPMEINATYSRMWPLEEILALQGRTAAMAHSGGVQGGVAPGAPAPPASGPRLGIRAHNITAEDARNAGMTEAHGVVVDEVAADSFADGAKVQAGDVLLEIDGVAVGSVDEIKAVMQKGTPARIKVWRKGQVQMLVVAQSL